MSDVRTPSTPVVLLLLWSTGLYLRLTVMVGPPLAPIIASDLELGQAATGAVTTFPILMLAAGGIAAAWIISRIGARRTLVAALALVALSSAARGLGDAVQLFAWTAAMGLAIAGIQPALPTLLTEWWPRRIALGTAVYMNGMLVGEVFGSTLTLPIMLPLADDNWRLVLLYWSMPALIPAALILLLSRASDGQRSTGNWMPALHRPLVWQLGILLGASGSLFFGTNAYMGSILLAREDGPLLTMALAIFNGTQIIASLLMFWLARHWVGRAAPFAALMLTGIIGLSLFALLPGLWGLAALLPAGLAAGMMLILMVALPPLYTSGNETAGLAAGMFAIGAVTNFGVPLFGGFLADWTSHASMAIVPIIIYALIALPLALRLPRA